MASKVKLGPGVDIKSTGGHVVAAPSWIAPSNSGPGGSYVWEISPFDEPVPRLPIWVTVILAPIKAPAPAKPPPLERARRNGSKDVESLANWVARSTERERNNRLHWAACRVGELAKQHRVSESSAGRRLVQAAMDAGLTGLEAARTVDSGFKKSGLKYQP